MSYTSQPEGGVVLRLEFSIADAVHQRGLLAVIASAIGAWWIRPRLPQNLPPRLRADLGLPPDSSSDWFDVPPYIPDPLRRPGM